MGEAKKRSIEIEAAKKEAALKLEKVFNLMKSDYYRTKADLGDKKSRHAKGQYFTPPELGIMMVQKFGKEKLKDQSQTTLDPCCGYGNLLLQMMHYEIEVYGCDPLTIMCNTYGNELDPAVLEVCKENLRKFAQYYGIASDIAEVVIANNYHTGDATKPEAFNFTPCFVTLMQKLAGKVFAVAAGEDEGSPTNLKLVVDKRVAVGKDVFEKYLKAA